MITPTTMLRTSAKSDVLPVCAVCKDLVATYVGVGLQLDFHALGAASRSGCQSCLLVACVLKEYGVNFSMDYNVSLFVKGNSTLKLRFDDVNDRRTREELDLFILEGSRSPWPSIKSRRPGPGNCHVTAAADQITRWLEVCSTNHSSRVCGHASAPKPLPTRLLQIRGYRQIRLYTPSPNERGCYVCLSHCWGGSVALQTTRATELEFHDHIDWSLLPCTFKDAVDLTWRLGLEYLWIDSLSILQDDLDDWRHEGSKMASIYSNSFVTLAATKSVNANGGFYTVPNSDMFTKIHKIRHKSGKLYTIHSRRSLRHTTFVDADLPLLIRAWAFQERLLSPRVVHFADKELLWECTEKGSCECRPNASGSWSDRSKSRLTYLISMDASLAAVSSQMIELISKNWYEIVSFYTTLNLTFQTDALPALQGIAKKIQLVRNCSYVAGLWEDTIVNDLQWFPKTSDASKVRVYQPPSWSWASRGRGVTWFRSHGVTSTGKAYVTSISITPKGLDPTGEVAAGLLTILGRRVKAHLSPASGESSQLTLNIMFKGDDHTGSSYTTLRGPPLLDITLDKAIEVELLEMGVDHIDTLDTNDLTVFLCLRLVENSVTEKDCHTVNDIPTFERIGIGHLKPDEAAMCFQSEASTIRLI